MNYFITYDISGDRHRTKLAKELERRGCKRIQYSVFFFKNPSAGELAGLRAHIRELLEEQLEKGDSVLIIPVEDSEARGIEVMGESPAYKKASETKHVWFF